jgi:hypothetical protein
MEPLQQQINEVNKKIDSILLFIASMQTAATINPMVARTILDIVGTLRLSDLDDVTGTDSATNGHVLKYNGSTWAPGTDNVV